MKRYGLIGFPLAHSFSKQYFERKFVTGHIADCSYENFEIENVLDFKSVISAHKLDGLNVTIPHKESVLPLLDNLSDEAKEIGAVNCIRIIDGVTSGYNTDAYGFEMSIKPFLENKYERALVLGTGGASQAICYVLKKWGIEYHLVSRKPGNARVITYDQLSADSMKHFQLIINTTPVGTFPNVDAAPPIPYEAVGAMHFLYDLVYNPAQTLFLKRGLEAGAHTMNGLKMLELQAERSWQIWQQEA